MEAYVYLYQSLNYHKPKHEQLCVAENLVLLADEVYQANVYVDDRQFVSFRKVRVVWRWGC